MSDTHTRLRWSYFLEREQFLLSFSLLKTKPINDSSYISGLSPVYPLFRIITLKYFHNFLITLLHNIHCGLIGKLFIILYTIRILKLNKLIVLCRFDIEAIYVTRWKWFISSYPPCPLNNVIPLTLPQFYLLRVVVSSNGKENSLFVKICEIIQYFQSWHFGKTILFSHDAKNVKNNFISLMYLRF